MLALARKNPGLIELHDYVCSVQQYVVRLLDMGLSVGERLSYPDAYRPVTVCVTSATSPSDFWCRRCIDDDASTTELPLLMDRIADLYANVSASAEEIASFDDEDRLYAARYLSLLLLFLLLLCCSRAFGTRSVVCHL